MSSMVLAETDLLCVCVKTGFPQIRVRVRLQFFSSKLSHTAAGLLQPGNQIMPYPRVSSTPTVRIGPVGPRRRR